MDKCRICLGSKKNLCSVFEVDSGISYADMLSSVANVKIVEGCNNSICLPCRRKLQNLYCFKKEIERADLELNRQQKYFIFDNINDIKVQLMQEAKDDKMNIRSISNTDYTFLLENDCESFLYKNTTITKKGSYKIGIAPKTEDMRELDLKTDYETDNDLMDLHDDWDYTPVKRKKSAQKPKKSKDKGTNKSEKYSLKKVCIKPIFLDHLRVIRTQAPKKKAKKNERKAPRKHRTEICPYCGKMVTQLDSHILVHIGEKKYKCSECNKGFFTRRLLQYHQVKHSTTGAFKCDHCVAVFNYKAALQSHLNSHINVRNHICSTCNKGFKKKSHLQRHEITHNSSAKSFKCDLCNMSFFYNQGLKHHMRIHTGERPYNCEICSQPYSYKHDFNRHCLKKHGVFLKRRSVYVMNEEVLKQERALMNDLVLRVQGIKNGEPINPFKGPSAALAFKAAVEALGSNQIPIHTVF